jgi:hypothetical protein
MEHDYQNAKAGLYFKVNRTENQWLGVARNKLQDSITRVGQCLARFKA